MSDIWNHYVEIITDPAHTLVETTFIAAEFVIFSIIAVRLKKAWTKMLDLWHKRLDEEHGYEHARTDQEILNSVLHPPKKSRRPRYYKGSHRVILLDDGDPGWFMDEYGEEAARSFDQATQEAFDEKGPPPSQH